MKGAGTIEVRRTGIETATGIGTAIETGPEAAGSCARANHASSARIESITSITKICD